MCHNAGADLTEIMDHVGWTRRHMPSYYLQLAKVLNPAGASARLAAEDATKGPSRWTDITELKRFVCAFPVPHLHKRPHPDSVT